MARSKKILLKKPEGEGWTMKVIGEVRTAEVCDALLGALGTAVRVMVAQENMPPELIKELVNKEIDIAISGECDG